MAELADLLEALGNGDNMIAALDVHYDEIESSALAAAVVFQNWEDEEPLQEYTVRYNGIAAYVPGQFFQRELPCLLAVLGVIQEPINTVVIDGYVSLGDKPGLGIHLWEALQRQKAVVGVAKTRFHSARRAGRFSHGASGPRRQQSNAFVPISKSNDPPKALRRRRKPMLDAESRPRPSTSKTSSERS